MTTGSGPTADPTTSPDGDHEAVPVTDAVVAVGHAVDADHRAEATSDGPARRGFAHVRAFDGFRGVGAIVVLIGNAEFVNGTDRMAGSWLVVDMFFVLSGYLITSLLLTEARGTGQGRVDLRRFWARRVRRLGPPLVVTLVGVGLFARFIAPDYQRLDIRWDGFATLFEVMNWRVILTEHNYWSQFLPKSPLKHAWSLSVEEQFYVLWPLLLAVVLRWRKTPFAVLVTALVGAVVSTATMLILEARGNPVTRLYEGTDTRATAVLLGCALAAWRMHLGPRRWRATRRGRIVAGTIAAVPLTVLWVVLPATTRIAFRGWLTVAGILATIVIASIADPEDGGPLGRVFHTNWLVELGRTSYGLYLYHWPIFLVLDQERTGLSGLPLFLLRAGVSIAAAWLSLHYIETPIRKGALSGRQGRAAVPAGMAIAVIALLAGTFGAQPPPSSNWNFAEARSSAPDAPLVMFAGDSVPMYLAAAARDQVNELKIDVGSVAVPGCHLLNGVGQIRDPEGRIREDTGCGGADRFLEGTRAYRPDVSILLFGRLQNDEVKLDGQWRMPCTPVYDAAYRARLLEVIGQLRSTGGKVVLVSGPSSSVSWVVDAAPPGMFDRIQCMNDLLEDVAKTTPGVGFVDLAHYICPELDDCKQQIDGINLRPDTAHFVGPSAELVNRWLIPRVLAAATTA